MTSSRDSGKGSRVPGQAVVELALAMPIILFIALGFAELGFLIATKAHQDRSTYAVAGWASQHPGDSWESIASKELPGCDVEVDRSDRDLTRAIATCAYTPRVFPGLFDGLPITSEEVAADPVQAKGNQQASPVPS